MCSYTTCDHWSVPTVGTHTALLTFYRFNITGCLSLLFAITLHLSGTNCYKNVHYLLSSKNFQNSKRGLSYIVNGSTAQACIVIINNYSFIKLVQFWNLYVCTYYENLTQSHQ